MADIPRPKETTMSSGTFSELPTIPQAKGFDPPTPLGSDEFDFAPKSTHATAEGEPADYLNAKGGASSPGRISPLTQPPALNTDVPALPADVTEAAEPPSPVYGRKSV